MYPAKGTTVKQITRGPTKRPINQIERWTTKKINSRKRWTVKLSDTEMNLGKCQRPDDRSVDHDQVGHVHYPAKRLLSRRLLGQTIWKKKVTRRNNPNEVNNPIDGIRMKGTQAISWEGNYCQGYWSYTDWKYEGEGR